MKLFRELISSLTAGLLLFSIAGSNDALAKSDQGTKADEWCTQNNRSPATPYANRVIGTWNACALCHTNSGEVQTFEWAKQAKSDKNWSYVCPTPANGRAPNGEITTPAGDVTIPSGGAVTFAATGTDPDGDALTYRWDFGNGQVSNVQNPGKKTFTGPQGDGAVYTVTLIVTDARGVEDPTPAAMLVRIEPSSPSQTIYSGPCTDTDKDGFAVEGESCGPQDLADQNPALNPAAVEICNDGVDNDGDGAADLADDECQNCQNRSGYQQLFYGPCRFASNEVNAAPTVKITQPANGTSVIEGTAVTFVGTASDAEDGNLSAKLAWISNLDGAIGTGGSISKVLSVGSHTITARVSDSGGKSASGTLAITVTPKGATGTAVTVWRAEWNTSKRELRVRGTSAPKGATVTIVNGLSGAPVGSAVVSSDGTWEFRKTNPAAVPCSVKAGIGSVYGAVKAVSGAPSTCVN